jgi:hypothetical protein
MRMSIRRFTRLARASSINVANREVAVAHHFTRYNSRITVALGHANDGGRRYRSALIR